MQNRISTSGDMLDAVTRQIAELSGRMALAHSDLQRMRADLAILDATVRTLTPDLARLPRHIRANRTTEHGNISRSVLDALRRAPKPLTTPQVAAACGVDPSRALATLRYQQKNGVVRAEQGAGVAMLWTVATTPP